MSKYNRHQSVINRQSDASYSEDHWLKEFENKLQKTSVQPRGQSLFDEISTIMNNGKAKYPSVQAAVDDMMQRSGLSDYLDQTKYSEEDNTQKSKKTAQVQNAHAPEKVNPKTPDIIKEKPSILRTLENIIKDTRGNMPVPAIISRLHSLHASDIPDEGAWEDEKLIRLVSQLNLQAKKDNPSNFENFDNLGKGDFTDNSDVDPSNTDAFNILMPAKI
jgi:hypothetical protein